MKCFVVWMWNSSPVNTKTLEANSASWARNSSIFALFQLYLCRSLLSYWYLSKNGTPEGGVSSWWRAVGKMVHILNLARWQHAVLFLYWVSLKPEISPKWMSRLTAFLVIIPTRHQTDEGRKRSYVSCFKILTVLCLADFPKDLQKWYLFVRIPSS